MKLMEIKAIENKTVKPVLINPNQIETMEAADDMSKIVTASGRAIYSEDTLYTLYTMWMMARNVEMELAYNTGVANARAQYEAQASAEKESDNEKL